MRRRYVQLADGTLIEAGNALPALVPDSGALWGDRHYSGLRATDGTMIDTRSKHRAYMRDRGLTTVDDFTGTFDRARAERERFYASAPDRTRAGDVARAWEKLRG